MALSKNNTHAATRYRTPALVVNAVLAIYPLAIYAAEPRVPGNVLFAGFLLLAAARLAIAAVGSPSVRRTATVAAIVCAGAGAACVFGGNLPPRDVRLYPVAVNLALFVLFFGSLFTRRPLAERIARLTEPTLPPAAVRYTRRVTWLWSGVTLFNTAAAAYTALFTPLSIWSLYNGLIVYLLIGAVFGLELAVRRRYRRAMEARS